MMIKNKKILTFAIIFLTTIGIFSFSKNVVHSDEEENFFLDLSVPKKPSDLKILIESYPDVDFDIEYDSAKQDWHILMSVDGRKGDFWWAEGKMLPEEEIVNKEKYWSLVYDYPKDVPDPSKFTQEDIKKIREETAPSKRKNGAKSTPFFYDVLYDCKTRATLEQHIKSVVFLGKRVNLHERLEEPLARVEKRIKKLAERDSEVKEFIKKLGDVQSYSWREIQDSGNRSFHSMGVGIDVLPKGWGQKNIYWAWRRDIDGDNWMLLPLERRWMPPESVIKAFEKEGFIWGGKWIIWDNMHFEYHPEQILKSKE